MKPQATAMVVEKFIQNHYSLLLTGSPGIGKTNIIEQVTANLGQKLIISHPVVSDPTDYKGYPVYSQVENKAMFVPFSDLEQLILADEPTVFFLDDLGQAPMTVQAAAMQLILGRRVNEHKVSDQVTFVAATNRRQDKAGVQRLIEPLKSRFVSIIELQTDPDEWVKWAIKNNIDKRVIAFIRWRPNLLDDFKATADLTNSPSPRTNYHVSKILQMNLPMDIADTLVEGAAGEGYRAEFIPFLRVWTELPNVMTILMDPENAEIPDRADVMYALTGAIAAQTTKQNMESVCKYASRLEPEYSIKMIADAKDYSPDIQKTEAFIKWAEEHKEFVV